MNAKPLFLALSVLLAGLLFAGEPSRAAGATPSAPDANPKAEALIDQLTQVDQPGVGYSGNATFDFGFDCVDDHPNILDASLPESVKLTDRQFAQLSETNFGALLWRTIATAPALKALVRLGPEALPALIEHIEDPLTTKLRITGYANYSVDTVVIGDEYDPRAGGIHPTRLTPWGQVVNLPSANKAWQERIAGAFQTTGNKDGALGKRAYTVRVGDLCFVAIGQIVNRNLVAVRYNGEIVRDIEVNSPVFEPDLAGAVRKDWGGVTPTELRASLTEDAMYGFDTDRQIGAVQRLCYYFPRVASSIVVRLLQLPQPDPKIVQGFLDNDYYPHTSWDAIGSAAVVVPRSLVNPVRFAAKLKNPTTPIEKYMALRLKQAQAKNPYSKLTFSDSFNDLLDLDDLYQPTAFANVALRPQTRQLLKSRPQGDLLSKLNRMLLEDAFPREFVRAKWGTVDMPQVRRRRFAEFVRKYGAPNGTGVEMEIYDQAAQWPDFPDDDITDKIMLYQINPAIVAGETVRANAISLEQIAKILDSISWFQSDKVDAATDSLLQRLLSHGMAYDDEDCGVSCVKRLLRTRFRSDAMAFAHARITELSQAKAANKEAAYFKSQYSSASSRLQNSPEVFGSSCR